MYKIYINETPLLLTNNPKNIGNIQANSKNLVVPYLGKSKTLLNYIDMLEKKPREGATIIYSENYEKLEKDFLGLFKIIEAAGGIVINEENKLLAIYRMGWWDLPKGKIDKGEDEPTAAVREVQEETGISTIELGDLLHISHHTYRSRKGKRILKRTFWYKMTSSDTKLVPQAEEDIEEAKWMKIADFLASKPLYASILEVVQTYQDQIK